MASKPGTVCTLILNVIKYKFTPFYQHQHYKKQQQGGKLGWEVSPMAVSLLRRPREMSTGMQGLVRMVVVSPLAGM